MSSRALTNDPFLNRHSLCTIHVRGKGVWSIVKHDPRCPFKTENLGICSDMGFDFDDINPVKIVSSAVEGAADIATSVIDRIPGGSDLRGAVKDFANTNAGKTFFRSLATVWGAGLTPIFGAPLASVAFAVPGLAAGDSNFLDAWMKEFKWRVEKTSELLGGDYGKKVGDAITSGLDRVYHEKQAQAAQIAAKQGGGSSDGFLVGAGAIALDSPQLRITESIQQFAARYGIREDVAALIISAWNHSPPPNPGDFNMANGKQYQGTISAMGKAKGQYTGTVAAMGKAKSNAGSLAAQTSGAPDNSAATTETVKKVAIPVGAGVVGVGGALAAGLALPFVAGIGLGAAALGWLFTKKGQSITFVK